jgi:hypothetical protein
MARGTTNGEGKPMTIVERNTERMVVESNSALSQMTLALDKRSGHASLARKTLLWNRKPREFMLRDIADVTVAHFKDGASGAEVHQTVLRLTGDDLVPLPLPDAEAEETAQALREFLGLKAA